MYTRPGTGAGFNDGSSSGAGLRQHVDAVGLRVGVAAGRAAAPRFVTSHYHPPLFHPVDAGSQFVLA